MKDKSTKLKKKTSVSFGFEWNVFDEMKPEKSFLEYISPINKSFFKNKLVLDAGCGSGGYGYYAAKYGAEVIAFDLSNAVKAAYKNTKNENVQVLQADIYHLPFKNDLFDYIFCIGVLHHLPEPEKGFKELVKVMKRDSLISIWVYGRNKQLAAVYIYEPIIKITKHMPHKVLYCLCYLPATLMELSNIIYRFLNKIGLSEIANLLPFKHYSHYPFKIKLNDSFDTFATPSAKYYTEEEIKKWFEDGGLKDIKITTEGVAKGIKGFGVR